MLRQYARMGLLGTTLKAFGEAVFTRKPLKDTYPQIRRAVDRKLQEQYGTRMDELVNEATESPSGERSKTIWSYWWQGKACAPRLVKTCWASQRKYMPEGWRHVVVTKDNYREYVTLPEGIEEKRKSGQIPHALFSDLVRLELLIKYGGIWMDASVLCTEPNYPARLLTCPLFMFQYRNAQREFCGFSNWFIAAERDNRALKIVRALLYQYWRDYDCVVEYYIFHLFINQLAHKLPEILQTMPRGNAWSAIRLGDRLAEPFDAQQWDELTQRSCFHKLNYRKETDVKNSYCSYIIEHFEP